MNSKLWTIFIVFVAASLLISTVECAPSKEEQRDEKKSDGGKSGGDDKSGGGGMLGGVLRNGPVPLCRNGLLNVICDLNVQALNIGKV